MTLLGRGADSRQEPDDSKPVEPAMRCIFDCDKECQTALCRAWAREGDCLVKVALTRFLSLANGIMDATYSERLMGRKNRKRDEEMNEHKGNQYYNERHRRR